MIRVGVRVRVCKTSKGGVGGNAYLGRTLRRRARRWSPSCYTFASGTRCGTSCAWPLARLTLSGKPPASAQVSALCRRGEQVDLISPLPPWRASLSDKPSAAAARTPAPARSTRAIWLPCAISRLRYKAQETGARKRALCARASRLTLCGAGRWERAAVRFVAHSTPFTVATLAIAGKRLAAVSLSVGLSCL